MKRAASGMEKPSAVAAVADDGTFASIAAATLGSVARKARIDDGSYAALELAIETDDELEADEMLLAEGADDDEGGVGGAGVDASAAALLPQEELIRRRLRRMKELHSLYKDQYWRLLEELRRRHYRFSLRNGHGGRKEEAAAAALERDRAGLPVTCACGGCDAKPMPLSHYCFAHICQDPKQVLYAQPVNDDDDDDDGLPVMCTEDLPLPPPEPAGAAATAAALGGAAAATGEGGGGTIAGAGEHENFVEALGL